jgi:hypothetical protein
MRHRIAVRLLSNLSAPNRESRAGQVWLEEFAWTEDDLPKRLQIRNCSLPHKTELEKEPMFCFQTMINCLYWSALVYDYDETPVCHIHPFAKTSMFAWWSLICFLQVRLLMNMIAMCTSTVARENSPSHHQPQTQISQILEHGIGFLDTGCYVR